MLITSETSGARLALITGNSRGLGRALTLELRQRGWQVEGCSRHPRLGEGEGAQVDVSQSDQVQTWAAEVLQRSGPPELLLLNAAITTRPDPWWEQDPAEVGRLLLTNVAGPMHCLRAFVPAMRQRGRGLIVLFSSDWGRSGAPLVGPYCASKWALEGMMRSLALELPSSLTCVALDPGTVDTDMLRFTFGESSGEFASPEAWAGPAAEYLLSLGPQHHGQSLTVPGG